MSENIIENKDTMRRKAYCAWRNAIGLQDVDGLKTSTYLLETSRRQIEGLISIDKAKASIDEYYERNTNKSIYDDDKEEADKVSVNIVKLLMQPSFEFSTNGFINVHRKIFEGVFDYAGQLRRHNIVKREWVLAGDSVHYMHWEDIRATIDYDIEQERKFSYDGLKPEEAVRHLVEFTARLWQIHPFEEGNTRTTAVFILMYLSSLGFDVDSDIFAEHSWYFRNALVRANYRNIDSDIDYSPIFLERFFCNMLLGDNWELRNRYMHVHPKEEWIEQLEVQ